MYQLEETHRPRGKVFKLSLVAAAVSAATMSVPVWAFQIDTGNEDLAIRLDTTAKYSAGWRAEGRDGRIANAPNSDEGDHKFGAGDMVMNRVDVLSEFDLSYKRQYGMRVSGSGWYDQAYSNGGVNQSPGLAAQGWQSSYFGNQYSSTVKRFYNGPSAELLDAFVFANMALGETSLNVKVGQHTIYWGSATFDFFGQGIAYGQAPQDARKAAAVPGTTAKEAFLPVNQISFQSQILPTVSLAGQYFLDWKPSRFPEGGTYFASSDFLFSGPDRFPLAPGFSVPRADSLTPNHHYGSFGLSPSWTPDFLNGGSISAYYRQFDDPTPWLAPQVLTTGRTPSSYRLVYPKNVKLIGTGINLNVLGASVGADLSFRKDAPLLAAGVSSVDNEGPRGDTAHLLVNFVKLLQKSPFYDTGNLIMELSYSHLMSVTSHPELFRGVGYQGCTNGTRTGPGSSSDGCATKDFVGIGMQFEPQWLQVFPGVDLSMPITARYGISGNGATSLSGQKGSYSYSVGLQADIHQKYKVKLTYSDTYSRINTVVNGVALSGHDGYATNDRGWISLTMQTSF